MKKVISVLLTLTMLLSLLSFDAYATDFVSFMTSTYNEALELSGNSSFDGKCGRCVGMQLWALGINNNYIGHNGNDMYNTYVNVTTTSGGYTVNKYPASSYSMSDFLNYVNGCNTSGDYTFVALGFEKGSSSTAGQTYGHTLLIYSVSNGTVYYTDSWGTPAKTQSIADFCYSYRSKTATNGATTYQYEGAIWFSNTGSDSGTSNQPEKPALKNIYELYNTRNTITFAWDSTNNTTHYNIYLRKYNGSSYAYYENIFYAKSGFTRQLPAGEYSVLIQASNSNYWTDDGSTWLYTDGDWVYFTVFDTPEKPILKDMKQTYHTNENITFSWDESPTATHYSIFIDTLTNGEYIRTNYIPYAESGVTSALNPGKYRILLMASNSNYWMDDGSNWLYTDGDWVYFTVFDTPEKPVLKNMFELYNIRNQIVFSWDTSSTATHYNVYLRKYNGSSYAYYENIFYAKSDFTRQLPAGEYSVLIQATNSNYWTEDGSTWLYTDGDWVYFTVFDTPEKPILKDMKQTYLTNESISFSWDTSSTATHYNLYFDTLTDGEYVRTTTKHYAENGMSLSFEPGKYRVLIQATNSNYWTEDGSTWLYTDGDWVYFSVADSENAYTSSTVNGDGETLTVYTELYNLTVPYEVLIAGYCNHQLKTVVPVPITALSEEFFHQPITGDIDEIKVMAWHGISGLSPLCDVEVILESEFIIE